MGLGHADAINGRSNTGGGVYCYSDCVSPKEARRIIININKSGFGSGDHSVGTRIPGDVRTFFVPNIAYDYLDAKNKAVSQM